MSKNILINLLLFNLKNISVQSLSTVLVEFVIRLYFAICTIKDFKEDIDIPEDYSKLELFKSAFKSTEKMSEMLLAAHAVVTAVNLGKVSIKCISGEPVQIAKGLSQINITEIMSVVKYAVKVTKAVAIRNSDYSKSIYYAKIAKNGWDSLDIMAQEDELEIIKKMPELIIA